MKAIPISPGLILEIDPNADDKPLFCLRALDAENQKVFICYDEMETLIKALGDALREIAPPDADPPDAASIKARWG